MMCMVIERRSKMGKQNIPDEFLAAVTAWAASEDPIINATAASAIAERREAMASS